MGLFGKVFGKEEKKSCCEMEIVEVPEGEQASTTCDCGGACDASGEDLVTLTVLGPGCKRCHQLNDNAQEAAKKANGKVSVITLLTQRPSPTRASCPHLRCS